MYCLESLRQHDARGSIPGMSLGERVRELRERKGLSQTELAQAIGKQMLAVSQIERGKTESPRSDTLTGLAEALETSVDYLLYGHDLPAPTTSEPIHDEALLDMVAQVVLELQLPAEVEASLRAHPWSTGLPSYGTLRSYAVDLMGQRSGKLKPAPTTKVDVGEGMKREPRAKRRD